MNREQQTVLMMNYNAVNSSAYDLVDWRYLYSGWQRKLLISISLNKSEFGIVDADCKTFVCPEYKLIYQQRGLFSTGLWMLNA